MRRILITVALAAALGGLASQLAGGEGEPRRLLEAQLKAFQRITWVEYESSILNAEGFSWPAIVRGEPDPSARILQRRRLVLDLVDRRYRYERYELVAGREKDGPVLAYAEVGTPHRLERYDAKQSNLLIRWDLAATPDSGLFDQSQAGEIALLWPFRFCRLQSMAPGTNRNGILSWVDGTALKRFLAQRSLKAASSSVTVLAGLIGGPEEVTVEECSLTLVGQTERGEDPRDKIAVALRRMPWCNDAWLVSGHAASNTGDVVVPGVLYRAYPIAGSTDPLWLPALVTVNGMERTDRMVINGVKPPPELFQIDPSLARTIYDETARMPIER
jgi:hypothetical protein